MPCCCTHPRAPLLMTELVVVVQGLALHVHISQSDSDRLRSAAAATARRQQVRMAASVDASQTGSECRLLSSLWARPEAAAKAIRFRQLPATLALACLSQAGWRWRRRGRWAGRNVACAGQAEGIRNDRRALPRAGTGPHRIEA